MSSAVLYVAIVAIWAVILLPHWIRRPHSSRSETVAETEFAADAESEVGSESDVGSESVADVDADARESAGASRRAEMSHSEPVPRAPVTYEATLNQADSGGRGYGPEYGNDVPDYAEPTLRPPVRATAGPVAPGSVSGGPVSGGPVSGGPVSGGSVSGGPSASRQQMLRSRRRMLTILTALTLAALGLTGIGLMPWWLCVPPAVMLVAYLLLLREIAMADAEMATRREEMIVRRDQALAARADDRQRAREAWAASHPEPTAEIIDISGRIGDQLYDQYADAAVRAVGD